MEREEQNSVLSQPYSVNYKPEKIVSGVTKRSLEAIECICKELHYYVNAAEKEIVSYIP